MFQERSDRVRHREQIRAAARMVFAHEGVDASTHAVAARADVGVGTVYRHFGTRAALILGVLGAELERLDRRAPRLLRSGTPPGDAVRIWLTHLAGICVAYRGTSAHLLAAMHRDDSALSPAATTIRAGAGALLAPATETHALRADVTPDDLLALTLGAAWAAGHAPGNATTTATRLVSLTTEGLLHKGPPPQRTSTPQTRCERTCLEAPRREATRC